MCQNVALTVLCVPTPKQVLDEIPMSVDGVDVWIPLPLTGNAESRRPPVQMTGTERGGSVPLERTLPVSVSMKVAQWSDCSGSVLLF